MKEVNAWLAHIGAILGLVTFSWALFMSAHLARILGPSSLPHGIKQPGLAMQLAESKKDVEKIVRCCAECPDDFCSLRATEMRRQQSYDRLLIFLYTLFFLYLAFLGMKYGSRLIQLCALLLIPTVLAAATFNGLQDDQIVTALSSGGEPRMRYYAVCKWTLLSFTILFASPVFMSWRTPVLPLQLGQRFMLACATLSAWKVLWGLLLRSDSDLITAALCIHGFVLLSTLFLGTESWWRHGTQNALDRVVGLPLLRRLANWPQDD